MVRHAARLADALHAPLIAFHVERPNDNAQVQAALDLAIQLGGNVATLDAHDIVQAVLDHAARATTSPISSWAARKAARWRPGRRLTDMLNRRATAFTLHFVPVPAAAALRPSAPPPRRDWEPYLLACGLLAVTTLGGMAARPYIPQEAMGLIFTGLIAAMASRSGRNTGLFTAVTGFFLWNFFFLPPLYTLTVADPRDVVALIVFLLVGLLTGTLAGRVRREAASAAARVEALRRISLFGQRFSRAATLSDVLRGAAEEAAAMTGAGIVLLQGPNGLDREAAAPADTALEEAGPGGGGMVLHP